MSKEERRSQQQRRKKQRQMFPARPRNKRMHERDPHARRSRIEQGLRWWAGIIFSLVFANELANILFALFGGGPDAVKSVLNFHYLVTLARDYPVFFWPITALVVGAAIIGVFLLGIEVWQKLHEHAKQRKTYLEAVKTDYQVIPLVIDPELNIPLPEPVYQRLIYVQSSAYSQEQDGKSNHINAKYITDVLNESLSVCIVLLGDPGGGKTTFLRQSMYELAKQALADDRMPLPVYIALPIFADYVKADEINAVKNYFQEHELFMRMRITDYADVIQETVESGQVFLFVDSLDEVDPGKRQWVINWILKQQAIIANQGAIVLGTRYTDYDPARFALGTRKLMEYQMFTELRAQSMDHAIRVDLASELFNPLLEQIKRIFPEKAHLLRAPNVEHFITLIEQTQQQETLLGGNPLLFSLAAYLYVQDSSLALPTTRTALYGTFIKSLLAKVVTHQMQEDPMARDVGLGRDILQVLAEVALWTFQHLESFQDFTEEMLYTALQAIKNDLQLEDSVRHMSTWVVNSGVLTQAHAVRYAFRHHTIQEYLAAVALSMRFLTPPLRENTWKLLRQKRFIAQWYEPVRMFAGVLMESKQAYPDAQTMAIEWMDDLSQIAKDARQDKHDEALELAIASLSEIPDMAAFGKEIHIAELLEAWVAAFLQAAQMEQSEWLGRYQRLSPGISLLPVSFAEPAMKRLQQALINMDATSGQKAAAQVMEGLGSFITDITPFTQVLHSQAQKAVRVAVAHTLAVLDLRDGIQSKSHAVLETDVQGTDNVLASIVAMGLNGAGERSRHLMELAIKQERDRETRRLGTIALGSLGWNAKAALEVLTRDTEPVVAATAAAILQNLGATQEELRKRLLELAEHGDEILAQVQSILPQSLRRLGYTVIVHQGHEVILPPMVTVPAGKFLMGSDKKKDSQAYDNELQQFTFSLEEYSIGKYPLTVAEYACFLAATGYREPQASGISWKEQQSHADHPVVNISWNDMLAYTQWLAQVTSEKYRLPTEAEWEKAARGTDGRIYPWGDEWDKTKANTDDGGPGGTTPVGSYPQGASPYGCLDMAGNVWEWTSTMYREKYPYTYDKQHEDLNSTNSRVLRGGSWSYVPGNARAAKRYNYRIDGFNGGRSGRLVRDVLVAGSL